MTMMKKLLIVTTLVGLAGCSDPAGARKALEGAGYTDIEITGVAWTGCGQDDYEETGFKAKGPSGKQVEGAVCSGWPKGSTIRTY